VPRARLAEGGGIDRYGNIAGTADLLAAGNTHTVNAAG